MLRSARALLILSYLFGFEAEASPSVIIVGAGASGIAAATRLLENSISNITILEAENRIGGRIHTLSFGGAVVEKGAEYCHGQKGNIVYELTKHFNLLAPGSHTFDSVYYSNGSVIDPAFIQELQNFFYEFDSIRDDYNTTDRSVGDVFTYRFPRFFKKYKNDKSKAKIVEESLRFTEGHMLGLDGAFSWYDVSFQEDYEESEGDQDLTWKGTGYKLVLDILMKKYPDYEKQLPIDDKIHKNKRVTKIFWKEKEAVTVLTSDQSTYKADYVIFTPSVGVLKAQKNQLFEPKLPLLKQAAIAATGFAGVLKFFVYFPRIWWNSDDKEFHFVFSKEDLANINFTEGPSSHGKSWVSNILTMSRPYGSERVWVGWIVGDVVPEVEKLSKSTLKRGVKYVLDKFLGKRYRVGAIGDIMISTWCSNDNFRGTYSFTKTGLYRKDLSYQRILGQPLGTDDGRATLLFAGEATNPHHFSTVHGAIETGHREADRIINLS